MFQVRPVSWPIKHSYPMVSEPGSGTYGIVGRCQVLLGEKSQYEVLQYALVDVCIDSRLWTTEERTSFVSTTRLFLCAFSWSTNSSLSLLLLKVPNTFERHLPDNPLQAVVILSACAPFSSTLSPSTYVFFFFMYSIVGTFKFVCNIFFEACLLMDRKE